MPFKKLGYFIYSAVFFFICALPGFLLLPFFSEESTAENRQLAELPDFWTEEGTYNQEWSSQFQDYVSDHFGFRQELAFADSYLKSSVFGVSSEEDVIIGKDGWLFYTPTVNDYLGISTVSELGLQNIIHNLELMQDYVELKGSHMLTAIVPNKNTVYPMYMPDYYQNSGETGNLAQLQERLLESNINYVSLTEKLIEEAESQHWALPVYHKQDTHWNAIGAWIGYCAIMDASGLPYENFIDASYTIEKNWEGDLQNMLFPDSGVLDNNAIYDISFTYLYQGHYHSTDDITITTINEDKEQSLLMFRDSFGAAIIPYFSQNFQTAVYSRARPNPLYQLETTYFDLVVLEIVERNIAWLQKEAPVHSALSVTSVPEAQTQGKAELFTNQSYADYLHCYGTVELPENLETAPDYFFTLTDSSGNILSYQAYNCYEADLMNTEEILDNGYSLYIPTSDLQSQEVYQAVLTVQLPDTCFSCSLGNVSPEQD